MHDDSESVSHVLTPASLIYGHRLATTPNSQQFEAISICKALTKRAKHQQQAISCFIRQWQREYLLSLQETRSIKVAKGALR